MTPAPAIEIPEAISIDIDEVEEVPIVEIVDEIEPMAISTEPVEQGRFHCRQKL